jgi:predicted RNA polymerase sigma factor
VQWPADGGPGNPRGWLGTVATRKLLDQVRSEQSRCQREERIARVAMTVPDWGDCWRLGCGS